MVQMSNGNKVQIIAFYEFKDLQEAGDLESIKAEFKEVFNDLGIRGTVILANEGYNGMVCGTDLQISAFISKAESLLKTTLVYKSSYHAEPPFRKIDVKIKPEIVTLKLPVDISLGAGTHVKSDRWNEIISDPETIVLDTRNDYEFKTGTFRGAINPETEKFSELPKYVQDNFDPAKHKRIAMFCTGGIRCEKFAPYMKGLGFEEVYQLEGGILKYLEEMPVEKTLWEGECYVFDERITVNEKLEKGVITDHSQRVQKRKKPEYKLP